MTLSRKSCLLTQLLHLNIRHPNWMLPVKNGDSLEFTAWCKSQGIAKDKIKHIIRAYNKVSAGDIKALTFMLTRFNGNYNYLNLCIYAVLNAIEFDLEQASASFNGDLAGIKIDGYTIKGGHHGTEKN